jgi:hypothetical protein
MRSRQQYSASPATVRALGVLEKHPGISATTFAGLAWPHLRPGSGKMKPPLLAAQYLRRLKNMGLVRIRYSANPLKFKAQCRYFLSDEGCEICEYHHRTG